MNNDATVSANDENNNLSVLTNQFEDVRISKHTQPHDCLVLNQTTQPEEDFHGQNSNGENQLSTWDTWDPIGQDFQKSYKQVLKSFRNHRPIIGQTEGYIRPLPMQVGHLIMCDRFVKRGKCNRQDCTRPHLNREQREFCWKLYNRSMSARQSLIYTYSQLESNILEDDGKQLLVTITKPRINNDFYVIVMYDDLDFSEFKKQDIEFFIKYVKINSSAFVRLRDMQKHFRALFVNSLSTYSITADNSDCDLELSQIVACRVKPSRQFVRAVITEMPDSESGDYNHKLFLIDIGIELSLPRELIYPIKFDYLDAAPMAVNVKLGIKPLEGESFWSEKVELYIHQWLAHTRYHLCQVVSRHLGDIFVDFINYETKASLTQELLDKGVGCRMRYNAL